jgi:uncharacterized protein YndB with AHSA1/START domain
MSPASFVLPAFDPDRDLRLSRVVDTTPERIWRCWTTPALMLRWFTPAPWTTIACDVDLRPGGGFRTTMRSPEGQEFPHQGCYLVVEAPHTLVWTGAMSAGFRPASPLEPPVFTGILTFKPEGAGTRYTAHAVHPDAASRQQHAEMGFEVGWGIALDQLLVVAKSL